MRLLNPYLAFRDDARDAMEFYRSVFGGELTVSTFGDFGAADDPADADKVMHAELEAPDLRLMASDTPAALELPSASAITLSIASDDESVVRDYWARLSDGGTVRIPLAAPQWGGLFGMCTDRFGVAWMVSLLAV